VFKRVVDFKSSEISSLLKRPVIEDLLLTKKVDSILNDVRKRGDAALKEYTEKFDKLKLTSFKVSAKEIEEAAKHVDRTLKKAIIRAKNNIEKFHAAQRPQDEKVVIEDDIILWRKSVPINRVGLYIPGGSAPLFSTVLMLAIPAKIAGCEEIVMCTPPNKDGTIDSALLFSASLCGVDEIYKVGGSQAIGSLAYGTESIKKVDKIFGPGNSYVTEAKQQVSKECAIDLPAGPSEVMVVIDESSKVSFAAADLLSQAEHGPDSQVILVIYASDKNRALKIADKVEQEVLLQLEVLERKEIAKESIRHSISVIVTDFTLLVDVINEYAAEHLLIQTKDYKAVADKVTNAGSIFLGSYSCESLGDYASGTNHTLPTYGWARSHSGVSLDSYLKKITFQEVGFKGLNSLGESVIKMAEGEGLTAHANAVRIRLKGK